MLQLETLSHPLIVDAIRSYALRQVPVQSQPIIWVHVDEVNSITYMRMLGSDNAVAANHMILQEQSNTELRSFIHCEQTFYVAATETHLLCHGA